MFARLSPIYSTAWRAAVVLFTIQIALTSVLRYVTNSEAPPPPIAANAFATPFLFIHVVASVAALLVGPLQFVRGLRARWPAFHRLTGPTYVIACAIGAPTGLVLAFGTTAGPVAGVGFGIQSLLWPIFTWLGWRAAVERRFDDHRDWMLRSYATTAAAITLRLYLPASMMMGYEFMPAYQLIAWLSWTTNLTLTEYYIRRRRASAASYAAA